MHTAVDGLLTTILGVGGALGGNDEVQGLERWVKITREMQGARTSILSRKNRNNSPSLHSLTISSL